MPRQGLTTESVVGAAANLLETTRWEQLTLHKLARVLQVQTASLYTHITGLEHLRSLLTAYALRQLRKAMLDAAAGEPPEKALPAVSEAYCTFARENRELYRMIMAIPHGGSSELIEAGRAVKAVLFDLLAYYTQDRSLQVRFSRQLHSLLHGFVSLDQLGFFDPAVPAGETLQNTVEDFVRQLQLLSADKTVGAQL